MAGKSEGADQKLRGWWDARLGRSCVTVLHKGLRMQRGSGCEVISVESRQSCLCTRRGREMRTIQTICSSSIHPRLKQSTLPVVELVSFHYVFICFLSLLFSRQISYKPLLPFPFLLFINKISKKTTTSDPLYFYSFQKEISRCTHWLSTASQGLQQQMEFAL